MIHSRITGVGASLPQKVVTNADLEKIVDTSDEWITSRTGIKERRMLADGEELSDHSVNASRQALSAAGLGPNDLDLIINATFSPDLCMPSGACVVQRKLGVERMVPAFDLGAACSGWVYGLEVADKMVRSGAYRNILLIGADAVSRYVDWKDRATCVLFGDAAGATIISQSHGKRGGVLASDLGAAGKHTDMLVIKGGGSSLPGSRLVANPSLEKDYYVYMAGNEVFKIVTRIIVDSVQRVLDQAKLTAADVDFFIPHQANLRIIQYVAEKLKMPMEKIGLTLDKYGNSSAATVPVTLSDSIAKGKIKPGDRVLFSAFGGGLTYATVLLEWE